MMEAAACKFSGPAELYQLHGRKFALTPIEQAVYEICESAANDERPLEPIEAIMEKIGAQGHSTVPGIMKRLETKGFIRRTIFQRGRQVTILATGKSSAPPSDTSPHWRLRTEHVPTPAIQQARQKMPQASALIEQEARRLGKHMTDFLADLVYIGWHAYQVEREQEA